MTGAQETMLRALAWGDTLERLAKRTHQTPGAAQRTLDSLYRRSLATFDTTTGRWHLTRPGHNKLLRHMTRQEVTA